MPSLALQCPRSTSARQRPCSPPPESQKFGPSELHLETRYSTNDSLKILYPVFHINKPVFPFKFYRRLPSRPVPILFLAQPKLISGGSGLPTSTRSCRIGSPSARAVMPLGNFQPGTTAGRWSRLNAHLVAIPRPIERQVNASR